MEEAVETLCRELVSEWNRADGGVGEENIGAKQGNRRREETGNGNKGGHTGAQQASPQHVWLALQ